MKRRTALGVLAGAASLPLMAQAIPASLDSVHRTIGIAIVGLGDYASFVLPRLAQSSHARLAALVSGDAAKARQWAATWSVEDSALFDYRGFDRIAERDDVDAVHICLPVGLHAEFAERALRAGKHVLCEKPLAATSAQARALIALARDRALVLMPAYRAWFSQPLQACLARLRELGSPTAIDAHKGFPMALPAGNWRFDPALAGGGALYDIGPYSIQLSRWAAGRAPRRVHACHAADPDPRFARVSPQVSWLLDFGDGLVATGSASWRYHLQNHARFATREGWIHLEPATPAMGERARIALPAPPRVEEPAWPPTDQIPRMYDEFALAIRERRTPSVDARDALADLLVIEAIQTAANGAGVADVAAE